MPAHPDTGIDFEADRFAIRLVSTGEIINMNATWPRLDGAPIAGANPDRAYYKRKSTDAPDADHRYTIATTWALVDFDPPVDPADGVPVGEYAQSHEAVKLPVEELKAQVETAFQNELRKRFPLTADPAILIEAGGALARKSDGAQLTAEQAASVEAMKGVEDVVRQLRDRQQVLNAAIDAGEDYDIEDWTISE
jgi:hypothetical protein